MSFLGVRHSLNRMYRRIVCFTVGLASLFAGSGISIAQEKPAAVIAAGELTLAQALAQGLARHPALAPYDWEIKAREAAIKQVSRPPNPSVGLEVEDVAGTGPYGGTRQAQTTLALSQPIELGGKRALRASVAGAARTEAEREREFYQQEVLFQVRTAFIAVLVAQEQERQLTDSFKLAAEVVTAVQAKVEAGKVSPVELVKAEASRASARKELDLTRQELAAARNQLAWALGEKTPGFTRASGELLTLSPVPQRDEAMSLLLANASVRAAQATLLRSGEELKLAKKSRLPDVTVSAGYRHFSAGEDHALLFGASVPLPVFQRQRGAEAEAAARLEKARAEEAALKHRLQGELLGHLAVLERTTLEAQSYTRQLLPAAREVFAKTREGYTGGKFSYLELLDAQRELLKLQREELEALARHHLARAELDRLLGLNPVSLK
jgi:cobalt-zinc-cadmium efflux system outer membrane protein